jgi:dipeptidyl aminopeptidase/acylaminoacyl peptidase
MIAAVRIEETTFRSDGVDCAARIYRPHVALGEATPCIVTANGFSLTRDDGLPAFAERFAGAGITALTFDFRHLGESGGEPRQLIDGGRQQADFRAAVAFARGLAGVDPDAVAVWGFSFAGGHTIYTAADDHEIVAAVALRPMTDVIAFVRSMPMRNSLGMNVATLRNLVARQRVHFPVVGPPGSQAQFSQLEALPGFNAVRDDDRPVELTW